MFDNLSEDANPSLSKFEKMLKTNQVLFLMPLNSKISFTTTLILHNSTLQKSHKNGNGSTSAKCRIDVIEE